MHHRFIGLAALLAVLTPTVGQGILHVTEDRQARRNQALLQAIGLDNLPAVQAALANRADPNTRSPGGNNSALHLSVYRQSVPLTIALLAAGANPDAQDHQGRTPLMVAIQQRQAGTADLLLTHGAAPDLADRHGRTALMHAAETGSLSLRRLALDARVRINKQDRQGRTPLMYAAGLAYGRGDGGGVRLLLTRGADFHLRDNQGTTALASAVLANNSDAIDLLLSAGADVNERDPEGRTPLIQALLAGNSHAAHRLLQRGASLNIRAPDGRTALQIAETKARSLSYRNVYELIAREMRVLQSGKAVLTQRASALMPLPSTAR